MKHFISFFVLAAVAYSSHAATLTYLRPSGVAPLLFEPTQLGAGSWTEVGGVSPDPYREGANNDLSNNADATLGGASWYFDAFILDDGAINLGSLTVIMRPSNPPAPGTSLTMVVSITDITGAPFERVGFGSTATVFPIPPTPGTSTVVVPLGGFASVQDMPVGTDLRIAIDVYEPIGGILNELRFDQITLTATPEPATFALMGTVFGLAYLIRRRR